MSSRRVSKPPPRGRNVPKCEIISPPLGARARSHMCNVRVRVYKMHTPPAVYTSMTDALNIHEGILKLKKMVLQRRAA